MPSKPYELTTEPVFEGLIKTTQLIASFHVVFASYPNAEI